MAVLHPVKLILTTIRRGRRRPLVENNPGKPEDGTRTVSFSVSCGLSRRLHGRTRKGLFRCSRATSAPRPPTSCAAPAAKRMRTAM
ncbi:MAG: hypothetical protein ACLS8R_07705 [Anaeromassilibacillus sp.]